MSYFLFYFVFVVVVVVVVVVVFHKNHLQHSVNWTVVCVHLGALIHKLRIQLRQI